jgi:hypothetical protein
MNEESLLEFIAKAHRNTYAASKEIKMQNLMKTPFLPGHKCYHFKDGDWEYFDGYTGSEWAPGREIVLYKGKNVWSMAYQGKTSDGLSKDMVEDTFSFLKEALRNFDDREPFRGPRTFSDGDFEYRFWMNGDYTYFTGQEAVSYKGKTIFFQDVMGTLVK